MSRINDLDKILNNVRTLSKDLAPISDSDLSWNVGIDIDLLVEYLVELKNRGFISYDYPDGSYITLQGRMALENARNGKPFLEELMNRRLKKVWSITKIIAAVLNSIVIIAIAIWAQLSSNENKNLENEIKLLKGSHQIDQIKYSKKIDSLNTIVERFSKVQFEEIDKTNKKKALHLVP